MSDIEKEIQQSIAEQEQLADANEGVELRQFMSANRALAQVAASLGEATDGSEIIDFAKHRLIFTRAKVFERSDSGESEIKHNADVPPWVFGDGAISPDLNFSANKYAARFRHIDREILVKLTGISFDVEGMNEHFPVETSSLEGTRQSPATPGKNPGGAPRNHEMWDAVTVAIARLANDGRLDPSMPHCFKTAAEFRRAVLDDPEVTLQNANEQTIKPLIRKVFDNLMR